MTQDEITDGNELIAEFIGSTYINKPFFDKTKQESVDFWHWTRPTIGYPIDQIGTELSTCWMIGNFKFHKSWDWLMPVVHKIVTGVVCRAFDIDYELLKFEEAYKIMHLHIYEGINTVYNQIIEFIKYYNSQIK